MVQPAEAFVVHNGWNYAIDTFNDSTTFNTSGNGAFEIYASAYKIENGKVTFAINSNVNLADGVSDSGAADGKIHFGDLFLNFTGKALDAANGELFGIRFAANNDSNVALGIYSDVTAKSVISTNNGWGSYAAYNNYVISQGVTPTVGDLLYGEPYLNYENTTLNSIQSGTKIGDINILSDLSNLGLDFGAVNNGKSGSQTIAFSFDAGLFPTHQTGIYLFGMECNNDIIAGYYTAVPTPAAILPTLLGLVGAACRKKETQAHQAEDEVRA